MTEFAATGKVKAPNVLYIAAKCMIPFVITHSPEVYAKRFLLGPDLFIT